ncbi:MAG: Ig-like domain-containing protein [Bifidobacteriaceae bacterium]|jgi:hypothetical protein|nr:Ig-like domain-containing protein [Bifidobacteriaceae bacterium]
MTTALARRFLVDVSEDNQNWVPLRGIDDLDPSVSPTTQDANDYDSDGWGSKEITLQEWSLDIKALRKVNAGKMDPGQELCRKREGKFGDDARIYARWYDRNGNDEAYSGRGIVTWKRSKTGVTDLEEIQVTISGDGPRLEIDNPVNSATTPTIVSILPAGAAVGDLVQITGSGFSGATDVDFGGTAATSFTVASDALVVAAVPTTGKQAVTVTSASGASNAVDYEAGAANPSEPATVTVGSVTLTPETVSVEAGKTADVAIAFSPENATDTTISINDAVDTSIATATLSGATITVTGVAAGSTTISGTVGDKEFSLTVTVTATA